MQKQEAQDFIISKGNVNHSTILHFAVERRYRELMEDCLKPTKQGNYLPNTLDNRDMAAVHIAIINRDHDFTRLRLSSGAVNKVGYMPALHLAIHLADAEAVSEIIMAQPKSVSTIDRSVKSPLHKAVGQKSINNMPRDRNI